MKTVPRHYYAPTQAQREELRLNAARIRAALEVHKVQKANELAFAAMLREIQRPEFVRQVVNRAIAGACAEIAISVDCARVKTTTTELEDFLEARFQKADARRFRESPAVITGFGSLPTC